MIDTSIVFDWEQYTQRLTQFFILFYFGEADWYWIGDEIGGTIEVNDYFFDTNDMVNFIRYKYSKKKMFAYMDELAENNFERKSSIKNWIKLK